MPTCNFVSWHTPSDRIDSRPLGALDNPRRTGIATCSVARSVTNLSNTWHSVRGKVVAGTIAGIKYRCSRQLGHEGSPFHLCARICVAAYIQPSWAVTLGHCGNLRSGLAPGYAAEISLSRFIVLWSSWRSLDFLASLSASPLMNVSMSLG
jgi:hypothetical protein